MDEQKLLQQINEMALKLEVYGEIIQENNKLTSKDILNRMQEINSKYILKQFKPPTPITIPLFPEIIHKKEIKS